MANSPERSPLEEGRWIARNRPELLGEIATRLIEDSEWIQDVDPTYFEGQKGTIAVTELLDKLRKEEI
jgi:hypothetical protein